MNGETGRDAFTLAEILVSVGVALLLAGLCVPAVHRAREAARSAVCASNLRQLAFAALASAEDNGGEFPWAMRWGSGGMECWDWTTDGKNARPGLLWSFVPGLEPGRVLQCPSYLEGPSNSAGDPYTGYNYNSSYVGKCQGDSGSRKRPARLSQLRDPARTALFGDGQWEGGANKFMRAPVREKAFDGSGDSTRLAGTQGFLHRGRTNVAFADGHVESLAAPFVKGKPGETAPGCGFLSPDNSLYGGK